MLPHSLEPLHCWWVYHARSPLVHWSAVSGNYALLLALAWRTRLRNRLGWPLAVQCVVVILTVYQTHLWALHTPQEMDRLNPALSIAYAFLSICMGLAIAVQQGRFDGLWTAYLVVCILTCVEGLLCDAGVGLRGILDEANIAYWCKMYASIGADWWFAWLLYRGIAETSAGAHDARKQPSTSHTQTAAQA